MRRLALGLSLLLILASPAWGSNFPWVRDSATQSDTVNANDHAIPNPTWSVSGDLALVFLSVDGTTTPTWPSSTYCTGDAWTELQAFTNDPDNQHGSEVRYCVLDAAMSGTENVVVATEMTSMVVVVIAKGTYTGTPEVGTIVTNVIATPSTSVDPPALNPAGWDVADTLWLVFASADGNPTVRQVASATNVTWAKYFAAGSVTANAAALAVAWHLEASASVDPDANILQLSAASEWTANTIAVQGAAPATSSSGPRIF